MLGDLDSRGLRGLTPPSKTRHRHISNIQSAFAGVLSDGLDALHNLFDNSRGHDYAALVVEQDVVLPRALVGTSDHRDRVQWPGDISDLPSAADIAVLTEHLREATPVLLDRFAASAWEVLAAGVGHDLDAVWDGLAVRDVRHGARVHSDLNPNFLVQVVQRLLLLFIIDVVDLPKAGSDGRLEIGEQFVEIEAALKRRLRRMVHARDPEVIAMPVDVLLHSLRSAVPDFSHGVDGGVLALIGDVEAVTPGRSVTIPGPRALDQAATATWIRRRRR